MQVSTVRLMEGSVLNEVEKALIDPASVFGKPSEVVFSSILSRQQKIDVLHRWESDARSLQSMNEEKEGYEELLSEILESMHQLDYWPDLER